MNDVARVHRPAQSVRTTERPVRVGSPDEDFLVRGFVPAPAGPRVATSSGHGVRPEDPNPDSAPGRVRGWDALRRSGASPGASPATTTTPWPQRIRRTIHYQGQPIAAEEAKKLVAGATTLTPTMAAEVDELAGSENVAFDAKDERDLAGLIKAAVRRRFGLSEAEAAALDSYQGGGFSELNRVLRGSNVAAKFKQSEQTTLLISALGKLPKTTNQRVFRTLGFGSVAEVNGFLALFTMGTFTTPQFDSTKQLAGGVVHLKDKPFLVNLRIMTNGVAGADIASALRTVPDYEHETLFPPGTVYGIPEGQQVPEPVAENATSSNVPIELVVIGQDESTLRAATPKKADVTKSLFAATGPRPGQQNPRSSGATSGISKEW